jgi:hypothetical protein
MQIQLGIRTLSAILSLTLCAAACNRGAGAAGGAQSAQREQQARADSAQSEEKALRDSGVSVDTQVVDTGGPAATSAEDN